MTTTEKRGLDRTLWNDPDHPDGLPWRKNTGFLWSLREEHGDEWVAEMAAQSETGEEIPPIRLAYRMWLRGARGALTAIANASQMPGDDYLDSILARPGMYAGPSVQALELVLVNLLNFRAIIFGRDHDPREILRKTYAARFGHSAGAGGPSSKLIEQYGDDPAHPEILGFYRAFVEAALD